MQTPNDDPILQLERKALDRWVEGGGIGSEHYADDVTYFDPLTRARIDGLQALSVYHESSQGQGDITRYELTNPQVVNAGDLALLTYNLTTYGRDANDEEILADSWNSTVVYRRTGGSWKILHAHWSYTAHEAFREPAAEGEAGA
ncbi:MAG TPA: nuclear transport factor 2 family protein [Pseudomonadales bacterium]